MDQDYNNFLERVLCKIESTGENSSIPEMPLTKVLCLFLESKEENRIEILFEYVMKLSRCAMNSGVEMKLLGDLISLEFPRDGSVSSASTEEVDAKIDKIVELATDKLGSHPETIIRSAIHSVRFMAMLTYAANRHLMIIDGEFEVDLPEGALRTFLETRFVSGALLGALVENELSRTVISTINSITIPMAVEHENALRKSAQGGKNAVESRQQWRLLFRNEVKKLIADNKLWDDWGQNAKSITAIIWKDVKKAIDDGKVWRKIPHSALKSSRIGKTTIYEVVTDTDPR